jgi:hypothetical protein
VGNTDTEAYVFSKRILVRPLGNANKKHFTMSPYQYVVSLRIWHPSLPLEEISEIVGRDAKHGWTAGTPRVSPKGKPLGGLRESSYWTSELTATTEFSDPIEVEQAISAFIEGLAPISAFFKRVRAEGGKSEFFVGLFSDGNIVVDLEPSLMGRLANAALGICLDYYPWKRDKVPAKE